MQLWPYGLYWPDGETLFVADPHIGKAAAFRAEGVGVPRGTTTATLRRLESLVERTGAGRLVVLGDLFHARAGRAPRTMDALRAWRAARPEVEVVLVRGNHDRAAGDPPDALAIRCADPPSSLGPFVLHHEPPSVAVGGYALAGHLHPAVRLRGRGRQRIRVPCFWFREDVAVLPALGEFTGTAVVDPAPGDRVFVVVEDRVVEV